MAGYSGGRQASPTSIDFHGHRSLDTFIKSTVHLIWLLRTLTANFDVRGARFDVRHVDILGDLEFL
jgi:hypothetical protein